MTADLKDTSVRITAVSCGRKVPAAADRVTVSMTERWVFSICWVYGILLIVWKAKHKADKAKLHIETQERIGVFAAACAAHKLLRLRTYAIRGDLL